MGRVIVDPTSSDILRLYNERLVQLGNRFNLASLHLQVLIQLLKIEPRFSMFVVRPARACWSSVVKDIKKKNKVKSSKSFNKMAKPSYLDSQINGNEFCL